MSMGSKRRGWRSAERTYKYLSMELNNAARREAVKNATKDMAEVLQTIVKELDDLHRYYYKDCKGGCPACAAIDAGNSILRKTGHIKTITPTLVCKGEGQRT